MKRWGFVAICLLGVALMIGLALLRFGAEPEPAVVATETVRAEDPELSGTVESVSGAVELWAQGAWAPVRVGQKLTASDRLRTVEGATAELSLGPTVKVRVAPSTELSIGRISQSLSRVRLEDGRLASVVDGSEGFRFRVEVQGSDAVAETEAGEFAVLKRGASPVSVASKSGKVSLRASGRRVELATGEQSVVFPGETPTPPARMPASLLLKLGRPPHTRLRSPELKVVGSVTPGTSVTIAGQPAEVSAAGEIAQTVRLDEGENVLEVTVEDAFGRKLSKRLPRVVVDSTAPPVSGEVSW